MKLRVQIVLNESERELNESERDCVNRCPPLIEMFLCTVNCPDDSGQRRAQIESLTKGD